MLFSKKSNKKKESLNNQIDWNRYKMKRNYSGLAFFTGMILYLLLAYFFLKDFIDLSNIKNTIIFVFGIISAVIFVLFAKEFLKFIK